MPSPDELDVAEGFILFPTTSNTPSAPYNPNLFGNWYETIFVNGQAVYVPINAQTTLESNASLTDSNMSTGYDEIKVSAEEGHHYLEHYALGEALARLAYKDLPNEEKITLEENGIPQHYRSYQIRTNNKGLVIYVLLPLDPNASDIKVIFRGTPFSKLIKKTDSGFTLDEAALSAISRDLTESGGAGSETFAENKSTIFSQLHKIIHDFPKESISITVAGHSLAGSDLSNFAAELFTRNAQNIGYDAGEDNVTENERIAFSKIREVQLYSSNGAGIPHKIASKANAAVDFLRQNRSRNALQKIKMKYLICAFDPVSGTGDSSLFADIPEEWNDFLEVDVLEITQIDSKQVFTLSGITLFISAMFNIGTTIMTALIIAVIKAYLAKTAHTKRFFESDKAPMTVYYQKFSNATTEGQQAIKGRLLDAKFERLNALHTLLIKSPSFFSIATQTTWGMMQGAVNVVYDAVKPWLGSTPLTAGSDPLSTKAVTGAVIVSATPIQSNSQSPALIPLTLPSQNSQQKANVTAAKKIPRIKKQKTRKELRETFNKTDPKNVKRLMQDKIIEKNKQESLRLSALTLSLEEQKKLQVQTLDQYIKKSRIKMFKMTFIPSFLTGIAVAGGGIGIYLLLTLTTLAGISLIGAAVGSGIGLMLLAVGLGVTSWWMLKTHQQKNLESIKKQRYEIQQLDEQIKHSHDTIHTLLRKNSARYTSKWVLSNLKNRRPPTHHPHIKNHHALSTRP